MRYGRDRRLHPLHMINSKTDTTVETFVTVLVNVRADGVPSKVEVERSDNGGEVCGDEFARVYIRTVQHQASVYDCK